MKMSLVTKPLFGIVLNGGVLYLLTLLVEEIKYTGGFKFFLIGGIVLGLVNFFIRPFIKMLSLPLVVITGGVILVVWNVAVLWFLSHFLTVMQFRDVTLAFPDVTTYVIGAVVFGVINWTVHLID
jgi:putative membrane protein